MKTAEEILKERYPELYEDKTTFFTALSAMEEYANQFKPECEHDKDNCWMDEYGDEYCKSCNKYI